MLTTNKYHVNIITYYLSRFLDDEIDGIIKQNLSYEKLGFNTRSDAHISIANQFRVKQSYVKNMEDCYDSIHSNHRVGWYQRELRPAQQEVVDKFSNMSENELFNKVMSLINNNAREALTILENRTNNNEWGEARNDDVNVLHQFARKIRKGQPRFRKNLIELFSGKCVITNCSIIEVLEAAHIVKHSISGINHSSNGLLLRSDIHSLFDTNKIKINPNSFKVEVDDSLKNSNYWQYNGKKIKEGINGEFPSKEYLKIKYES